MRLRVTGEEESIKVCSTIPMMAGSQYIASFLFHWDGVNSLLVKMELIHLNASVLIKVYNVDFS